MGKKLIILLTVAIVAFIFLPPTVFAGPEMAQRLKGKAEQAKQEIQALARSGGNPVPVLFQMKEVRELLDQQKFAEGEQKLDHVLLELDKRKTDPTLPWENSGSGIRNVTHTKSLPANKLARMKFPGVGNGGIFDPSIAEDPRSGELWISYSAVELDVKEARGHINTRVAVSRDKGATWRDKGIVNKSTEINLAANQAPNDSNRPVVGVWRNEVSALAYDVAASEHERWKMVWHHYLAIGQKRVFRHGWIAMKTAPNPASPWSQEQKLFLGRGYADLKQDLLPSANAIRLDKLDRNLRHCVGFSEPGLLATADGLYMSLQCGIMPGKGEGKIFLLKQSHNTKKWEYLGDLLLDSEAKYFGFDGFTGSELYEKSGRHYLITTPQHGSPGMPVIHGGCMILQVTEMNSATVSRQANGKPNISDYLEVAGGKPNGLCTYSPEAKHSGMLIGVIDHAKPTRFQIFETGLTF